MTKQNDLLTIDGATGEIMDSVQEGQLVQVNRSEIVTGVSVDNVFNNEGNSMISSVDTNTLEGKMQLFNAVQSDAKPLSEAVNIEFILSDYVAHNITLTEEDGSKTDGVRIVLLDDKGEAYSGSGVGIRNSLQKIFTIFGRPESWEDFKLKVKAVNKKVGKNGETTTLLEVVGIVK